jgi:hypothetical protein
LLDDILRFVEKKILGEVSVSEKASKLTEVTAKINTYALEFEGKFELEPDSREAIRKVSERQITELIDKINLISDQVRLKYQKPVLFLFEDTDKLDMAVARALFYERAATLTQFRASAIFLMDIGLRYSASFATLQQNFHDFKVLPNVKLKTREGQPQAAGRALLETLVLNRLEASLISDEALQIIITSSGGLSRTLVSLMRDAALIAAARNAQRIEANDAERAINRLRGNFIALLHSSDYPALLARHEDKRLNADEETQNLLEKLALLEYANDENWCDVHPILMPEVTRRTLTPVEAAVTPLPNP